MNEASTDTTPGKPVLPEEQTPTVLPQPGNFLFDQDVSNAKVVAAVTPVDQEQAAILTLGEETELDNTVTLSRTERLKGRLGMKLVGALAVVGLSAVTAASCTDTAEREDAADQRVPATAGPLPEPSDNGHITETTLQSPATTVPVTNEIVPQTPVETTLSNAAEPQPTETPATPEIDANNLSAAEIQEIVNVTGYKLAGHEFKRLEKPFSSNGIETTILGMDGAEPIVTLDQLEHYVSAAQTFAAERRNYPVTLQSGPETALDVTFTVGSSLSNRHVIIYADNEVNLADLTPYGKAAPWCFTLKRPAMDVSLIRNLSGDIQGVNANQYCGATEGGGQAQLTADLDAASDARLHEQNPDISNLEDPNWPGASRRELLNQYFQEVIGNSFGFAAASAERGDSYETYRQAAESKAVPLYQQKGVGGQYIIVDQAFYENVLVR